MAVLLKTFRKIPTRFGLQHQILQRFGNDSTIPLASLQGRDIQVQRLKENCIQVDDNDQVLKSASKKECHLITNINDGMLHRGFSVLLFNSQKELLLQQRSLSKITFPGQWSDSCSGHPGFTEQEMEEHDALGVKRAAKRRLQAELGIDQDQIRPEEITYMTRMQYKSMNEPNDNTWGEYEIAYLLVVQKDLQNLLPNDSEVKTYQYVTKRKMQQLLSDRENGIIEITPWLRLYCENFLFKWWDNLSEVKQHKEHRKIYRFC